MTIPTAHNAKIVMNKMLDVSETNGCSDCKGRNESNDNGPATTQALEACDVLYVADAPLDFIARSLGPVAGPRHPCHVEVRPGGPAANGGQVFVTSGYSCAIVCLQCEEWTQICRRKFNALGIQPFIIKRSTDNGAVTLEVPNGKPGAFDLYTERISPNLRLNELTEPLLDRIHAARVVLVGPMATPDGETLEVLRIIAAAARYSVLQPHADLAGHGAFTAVAGLLALSTQRVSRAACSAKGKATRVAVVSKAIRQRASVRLRLRSQV